jgi:uncharacterized protein YcbX
MFVKELWRYPVKSMAGERITEARMMSWGFRVTDRFWCATAVVVC